MKQLLNLLIKIAILGGLIYGGWLLYRSYYDNEQDRAQGAGLVRQVITINAEQVKLLLESGRRNNRPTLLFIFESENWLSRFYFNEIVTFYNVFPREDLNILLISLDQDSQSIAAFLHKKGFSRLKILRLEPSERQNMVGKIFEIGGHFDGSLPYVAVLNKSGHFQEVPFSWDRSKQIEKLIQKSINQRT